MNKRIKELAEQAGAIHIHGAPKDRALVGYENIEKFAKFIIEDDELNYSADHANKKQTEIERLNVRLKILQDAFELDEKGNGFMLWSPDVMQALQGEQGE